MTDPTPQGSGHIAHWAARSGIAYEAYPAEAWFRRWEPHDTIAPPSRYLNSCTWTAFPGHVVLVEPWYAADDMEPLERTVLAFALHPGLTERAAMRVGEHFLTRVAFLESPPPPAVTIGEPVWDENVLTFAQSSRAAAKAFHPRLRKLLSGWGFKGHIEIRPGGLILYYAGLSPTPQGYDRLLRLAQEVVAKATAPPRAG